MSTLRFGEADQVYFGAPGAVGHVSDPIVTRRKLAANIAEFRFEEGDDLLFAEHGQYPEIILRLEAVGAVAQDVPAVARPIGGPKDLLDTEWLGRCEAVRSFAVPLRPAEACM